MELIDDDIDQQHKLIESNDSIVSEDLNPKHNESLNEMFVHQMIETIEFVLGSVSNTASYLRLWALSLAHSQLSKVFYDLILGWSVKDSTNIFISTITIIIGFTILFMVTVAVILIMDTMECFLHALRLHWVEFQNKFFKGEGLHFSPFKNTLPENN